MAAIGVAICAVGELLGVRTLLVPGLSLVLLCALAAAQVRVACWRVRVSREPLSASVAEGSRVLLTARVTGPRLLRRSGYLAATPGAELSPRRWVDAGSVQFAATAKRRGVHPIDSSLLRFADPFGLCERTVRSPPTQLLVLPRIHPIASSDLARLQSHGRRVRAAAASSGEPDGVQPAQPGANAARIHWASSARTGTLMERRMRAEEDARALIVLDGRDAAGSDAFDMAVRAAASLAVALARAGGCSLLLGGERRAHQLDAALSSWAPIHARLALLEPAGAPASEGIARAGLLLWVTASACARVPARSRRESTSYLVSPHPIPAREVLFSVAGCSVQRAPARATPERA